MGATPTLAPIRREDPVTIVTISDARRFSLDAVQRSTLLLPQSEQDLACLGDSLGRGPVSMLSRGYGNCRVTATGLRDVWWVQYFNSDDKLILNTLEVTPVPAAVLAAQEDIDDSAERLREILRALTESAA